MTEKLTQLIREAESAGKSRIRAAARLMTLVESSPQRMAEALAASAAWPQPRIILGVTGSPGSGKSVLVDRLIGCLRTRRPEHRIGVIAVDPSSPHSGGALLGDRIRMMRHAVDPMVFIRSAASRGHLGGLMPGVVGVACIMGLIGSDVVVIETVGVGQGEIGIAKVADLVAIVFAPEQGDSIQLLKAGLIEIGDIFLVNKADRPGAARLAAQLRAALSLGAGSGDRRSADVRLISALTDVGVGDFLDDVEKVCERDQVFWRERRKAAVENEIRSAVLEELGRRCERAVGNEDVKRVLRKEASIADLVRESCWKIAKDSGSERDASDE